MRMFLRLETKPQNTCTCPIACSSSLTATLYSSHQGVSKYYLGVGSSLQSVRIITRERNYEGGLYGLSPAIKKKTCQNEDSRNISDVIQRNI
ncbi:hypothetical protein QQF64_018919 [Cirrhinus molitorella]|uniref:Uncharacterized protein n=1 Tax=Cirrhinus molitorella TaxID=172907 RepID=A0ABR3LE56_9TELE